MKKRIMSLKKNTELDLNMNFDVLRKYSFKTIFMNIFSKKSNIKKYIVILHVD